MVVTEAGWRAAEAVPPPAEEPRGTSILGQPIAADGGLFFPVVRVADVEPNKLCSALRLFSGRAA
jgi:hypothetical protein